eukprot:994748-Rhodomonas_salina.2
MLVITAANCTRPPRRQSPGAHHTKSMRGIAFKMDERAFQDKQLRLKEQGRLLRAAGDLPQQRG